MDDFKVITFDVEHGSCHVLITPSGEPIMIDAGSREDFSPAKHLRETWGYEYLRWLTITHHDSDHLTDINNIVEYLRPRTLEVPVVSHEQLYMLYREEFSTPLEVFLEFKKGYTLPAPPMGDPSYDWGGVQFATFKNEFHDLDRPAINDMSVVTFAHYQGWTFIFPGDLERPGWLKLLEKAEFREWLSRVDVFVAAHHGRLSGFCEEVFQYCNPLVTIISDKSISDTSCTDKYYPHMQGIDVTNTLGLPFRRQVLTTRNDGAIYINIDASGRHKITGTNI